MVRTPEIDDGGGHVRRYLAAYVRRRRRAAAARALAWAVAAAVTWVLLACLIDRLRPLPSISRAVALVIAVLGPAQLSVPALGRLFRRRFDPVAAAAAIEREHPAFAHRLVTAATPGPPSPLRAALDRDVDDLTATIGPVRVPIRPVVTAWAAAVVALALAAALCRWAWLDLPQLARRLVTPTAAVAPVTTVRLTVRPGNADVVEGRSIAVHAVATQLGASDAVTLHVSDDGGQLWTDRPMPPSADGFAATLGDVDADTRYFVTAGDAASPRYLVRVHRVPGVVTMRVRLDYPAALHRPPRSFDTADGEVDAPPGTTVTLALTATAPLRRAVLVVGADRFETTATADPCVRRGTFVVRHSARLAVELTAADGTPGGGTRAGRVRVQPVMSKADDRTPAGERSAQTRP
jgi:hypothetical protein